MQCILRQAVCVAVWAPALCVRAAARVVPAATWAVWRGWHGHTHGQPQGTHTMPWGPANRRFRAAAFTCWVCNSDLFLHCTSCRQVNGDEQERKKDDALGVWITETGS